MRRPLTYLSAAALCLATAVLCISACSKVDPMFDGPSGSNPSGMVNRRESAQTRHVFLLYFAGFNSLYEYMYNESGVSSLSGDYQDLLKGYIPANRGLPTDDILLTYTQFPEKARDYSGELRSHLVRLSRNLAGQTVRDTLKSYGPEYISADSNTLRTVLSDVKQLFPAKDYGLLFSSHATGWLPAGHTTSLETESRAGSGNGSGEEDGGGSGNGSGEEYGGAEAIGNGDGSGNGSGEGEGADPDRHTRLLQVLRNRPEELRRGHTDETGLHSVRCLSDGRNRGGIPAAQCMQANRILKRGNTGGRL